MNRSWPYPQKSSENQNRGTKRSRPIDKKVENNHSNDQKNDENDEDIDVPLSKRINRLNIEYTSQNDVQQSFQEKYPYEPCSTYYKPNELLYNLHEERNQRNQQAALHKALNSHLKL